VKVYALSAVAAVIGLLISFDVVLTSSQQGAILTLAGVSAAGAEAGYQWWTRRQAKKAL
jgi:hypothetical protein